jgi:anti-anti-sigma regulatory factor/CheY-like chemotaxis protein
MGTSGDKKNRRILIIDDNEDIHNDFREILTSRDTSDLDETEASFFGSARPVSPSFSFELTSVYQGADALKEIRRALQDGAPYALAFVDMRMPPGWDGLDTLGRLWAEDQALQAVICSAYSDCSWDDVTARFGQTDRLLILKKPFDAIEVRQIACALLEKWNQHHEAREATRRMAVQYLVTRILVESRTLDEAGPKLLRAISEAFSWSFGALWLSDDGAYGLQPACTWGAASAELVDLEAATARMTVAVGEGAIGRAFASGEPSWIASAAEDGGARAAAAARAGLHTVLHLPMKSGELTLGVLEFFDPTRRAPDQGLFDTMREVCVKIGQFVENKRVESALMRSEANNRGLLHAMPDTILRLSRDGTCLDYKASRDSSLSLQPRFCVKRPIDEALPTEVAKQLIRHVEQALADNATRVLEYRQSMGDEVREFEARIAGIDPREAVVIIRDVTEAKRAKADIEQKRAREETIRAQAEALMALSTPIIPITNDIVVIPLIGALDTPRMQQIQAKVVQGISARHTRVAILDVTGVTSLGAQIADEIMRVVQAARLLGAEVILTGIQPEIAQMLVSLAHDLRGVGIHRTMQSGIAFAMQAR